MTSFMFPSEQKFSFPITDSVTMHIKSVSHAVACIHFTSQGIKAAIPNNLLVYTWDPQNNKVKVIQDSVDNYSYILCWTDDYEIQYNGKKIISLENQRCWNITSHS